MPHKKSVVTLQELCWATLVKRFNDLKHQAEYLPYVMINELQEKILENYTFLVLPSKLFIHEQTTKLRNLHKFDENIDKLFDKVGQSCKKLTHLSLTSHSSLSNLTTTIQNNPRLRHLELRNTSCTDENLLTIATNCPQLQYLDLTHCMDVTDQGIHFLRNLPLLQLNLKRTLVTPQGCAVAVKTLPSLKCLEYGSWNKILTELTKDKERDKTYSIEQLSLFRIISWKMTLKAPDLFPKLKDISVDPRNSFFFNWFLRKTNQNLTRVTLDEGIAEDIVSIGRHCPMLEFLKITIDISNELDEEYVPPEFVPFKRLRELHVHNSESDLLSPFYVRMLLENCLELKKLDVWGEVTLSDALMTQILRSNPFECLEKVEFQRCSTLTSVSLMKLMELNNPLKVMRVAQCWGISTADLEGIASFVKSKNLDLSLEI